VIGPWSHGGRWYSSPLINKKQASDFDHVAEMVRFFDLHLRDRDRAISVEPPVHYFTMGEEQWKSSDTWPPPGTIEETLYLGDGQMLTEAVPDANDAADEYVVDFTAGTGVYSRFGKHLTGGRSAVSYIDRAYADTQLLTYTSPPVPVDVEVTGHPVVRLFVESTTTDCALLVYLEDMDPKGNVLCVTDGCIRASARATGEAPYWFPGVFHPYALKDPRPLIPGEVTEIEFDLFPVSWLFRRGHRIRVAISGADRDNIVPVAESEGPRLRVHRAAGKASMIVLPVMGG
jgi:putative CocE/NonD family hydrolase